MPQHLTDGIMAGLVDETLDPLERARALAHIRTCTDCRRAYVEAGRAAALWRVVPEDFPAGAEVVSVGRGPVEGRAGTAGGGLGSSGHRRGVLTAVLAAAAVIAIGLAGLTWTARRSPWDGEGALGPAYAAVLEASNRGPFVLPGVEDALNPAATVTRSGFVADSDSLRMAQRRLRSQYEQGKSAALAARWVAAADIATGQIESARALLDHARPLRDGEPHLATLDAVVAHIDGDLPRAEQLLRWVLERRPGDGAARVNLALVLRDLRRHREAAALLRQMVADRPGTPIAARAASVLSTIPES